MDTIEMISKVKEWFDNEDTLVVCPECHRSEVINPLDKTGNPEVYKCDIHGFVPVQEIFK